MALSRKCLGFFIILSFISLNAYAFNEYYHTFPRDRCIIAGKPDPVYLGNQIVHGSDITRYYMPLLNNTEYANSFYTEPMDLAYAFFLIGKRIGNSEANNRINWILGYIDEERIEIINSIIYKKFSTHYLKNCFSTHIEQNNVRPNNTNENKMKNDYKLDQKKINDHEILEMLMHDQER